ncbi:MAG: hypothetical protein ABR962_06700 [Candidatus Bathyarchaeia archaeon]|jgi:steroid 5-alpha reductase family enzyme
MKNWKLVLVLGLVIAVLVAVPVMSAAYNQSQAARTIHSFGTILPHS